MRRILIALPFLVAFGIGTTASAKERVRVGLGGGFGDPTGGSLKIFVHPQHALQFEVGWAPMHHGDGISHANYLFHVKPFVEHKILDFGMYFGAGVGVIFWADRVRGRRCFDPPGPDRYRCNGFYYGRHYAHGRGGGAAFTARGPVGMYVHWNTVPLDTVIEGSWSPYIVHWDPFHGDVSMKVRYYF